MTETS